MKVVAIALLAASAVQAMPNYGYESPANSPAVVDPYVKPATSAVAPMTSAQNNNNYVKPTSTPCTKNDAKPTVAPPLPPYNPPAYDDKKDVKSSAAPKPAYTTPCTKNVATPTPTSPVVYDKPAGMSSAKPAATDAPGSGYNNVGSSYLKDGSTSNAKSIAVGSVVLMLTIAQFLF